MNYLRLAMCGLCLAGLAACAGAAGTVQSVNVETGGSLTLDATKRVVLVTEKGGKNHNEHMVCAEPSPDAILAAAAQLAASAQTPQGISAGISAGFGQAVSSIATRTPTIQMIRDLAFRFCEARLNGAIDDNEYKLIIGSMDRVILAALAIDGLTQMRPAAVAISAAGTASTSKDGGSSAEVKPATVTMQEISYKPEEIKNIAAEVTKIVKLGLIDALKADADYQKQMSDLLAKKGGAQKK